MIIKIKELQKHSPRNDTRKNNKDKVVKNVKMVYNERSKIIEGFKNRLFPMKCNVDEEDEQGEEDEQIDKSEQSEESEQGEQSKGSEDVELDWIRGTRKQIKKFKKDVSKLPDKLQIKHLKKSTGNVSPKNLKEFLDELL